MPLNCSKIEREAKEAFFQKNFFPSLHPGPVTQTDQVDDDGDDDDDDDEDDTGCFTRFEV